MAEATWAEMKLIAKASGLMFLAELLEYRAGSSDHTALCDTIDRAIDHCAIDMARFPKELDPLGEDQLTVAIILQLKKYGFHADHDATSGGHCDIVISDVDDFLWLCEAKKVSNVDNSWIGGGFDQLAMRYDTGIAAQDRGSLIIFCNCERADLILDAWKMFFLKNFEGVRQVGEDGRYPDFTSEHTGIKTGRTYRVRHRPISVFFPPLHGKTSMRAAEA